MPSGLALLPPAAAAIAIAAAARFLTRLARNLHTSAAAAGGASEGGSDASAPRDGLPKKYSNLNELEADAQQLLTAQAYGYYAGGSENEWTLRENVAALARYRLLPRVLVDVSAVDTSTTLLGVCAGCAGCTGGRRIVGAAGMPARRRRPRVRCLAPQHPARPRRPEAGGADPRCAHGAAAAVPSGRRAGHGARGSRRWGALLPLHNGHQLDLGSGRRRGGAAPQRRRQRCVEPKPVVPGVRVAGHAWAGSMPWPCRAQPYAVCSCAIQVPSCHAHAFCTRPHTGVCAEATGCVGADDPTGGGAGLHCAGGHRGRAAPGCAGCI